MEVTPGWSSDPRVEQWTEGGGDPRGQSPKGCQVRLLSGHSDPQGGGDPRGQGKVRVRSE